MNETLDIYLLSIYGKLAPKTLEASRDVHNRTAGTPQNVAIARSLGDLSHKVFIPIDHTGPESGNFLILDQWNSMDGLGQFFANPQVAHQAGEIFTERDPIVWQAAPGLISYHCPAPTGRNDRIVGVVHGKVRSQEEAKRMHNAIVLPQHAKARAAGCMSHEPYFRMAAPGTPESLEFFAVDVWYDGAGMQKYYETPGFMESLMQMFDGQPMATVWGPPPGEWVEW